jgi:hypothetical protein
LSGRLERGEGVKQSSSVGMSFVGVFDVDVSMVDSEGISNVVLVGVGVHTPTFFPQRH